MSSVLEVVSRKRVLYPLLVTLIVVIGAAVIGVLASRGKYKSSIDLNKCRIAGCGKPGPKFHGTNGKSRDAVEDELPFHVAIFVENYTSKIICSGNLINDRWIITAANCLHPSPGNFYIVESIRVAAGIWSIDQLAENAIPIDGYWFHGEYDANSTKHNFALIKTTLPVNASSKHFVNPICLPFDDQDVKDQSVFGTTFSSAKGDGLAQDKLRIIEMKTKTKDCPEDDSTPDLICSKPTDDQSSFFPRKELCLNDKGGPLAYKNQNGSYILKAVATNPVSCGSDTGLYTDISAYNDWICGKMLDIGLE